MLSDRGEEIQRVRKALSNLLKVTNRMKEEQMDKHEHEEATWIAVENMTGPVPLPMPWDVLYALGRIEGRIGRGIEKEDFADEREAKFYETMRAVIGRLALALNEKPSESMEVAKAEIIVAARQVCAEPTDTNIKELRDALNLLGKAQPPPPPKEKENEE